MRLYPRTGHIPAIEDEHLGHVEAAEDGSFDLPDEHAARLHAFHVRGKPLFETDIERDERLHGEETARRRDPQTLYNAVEQIAKIAVLLGQGQLAQAQYAESPAGPPKAEPAKAEAAKAAPAAKAAAAAK